MVALDLDEMQQMLQELSHQFALDEIRPNAEHWDKESEYPLQAIKAADELGLLNLHIPEEYGGAGLGSMEEVVVTEELAWGDPGFATAAYATSLAIAPIITGGTEEQKQKWLRKVAEEGALASYCVTEPQAGSDVASIATTAIKDGDDYIINGSKMWITNSTQADVFCTLVNTSEGQRHNNKSLVIIPSATPGVSVDKPLKKLGLHSSDTAQIFFDNVRVPQSNRIGEEGMGFIYQMMQFQEERLFAAAASLKGMENNIQSTIEYTRERETFGKPILKNQVVQFRLAELQTEVEALRALVYDAVEGYIHGKDVLTKASMAKLKSGRLVREVSDSCLQYWGGMGFMWETGITRAYRDSRLGSIGGGSDEVMLGIISKQMGILD